MGIKKGASALWYSELSLHQLGSRPTIFIPRWKTHPCILYQVCATRGVAVWRRHSNGNRLHTYVMEVCSVELLHISIEYSSCIRRYFSPFKKLWTAARLKLVRTLSVLIHVWFSYRCFQLWSLVPALPDQLKIPPKTCLIASIFNNYYLKFMA